MSPIDIELLGGRGGLSILPRSSHFTVSLLCGKTTTRIATRGAHHIFEMSPKPAKRAIDPGYIDRPVSELEIPATTEDKNGVQGATGTKRESDTGNSAR